MRPAYIMLSWLSTEENAICIGNCTQIAFCSRLGQDSIMVAGRIILLLSTGQNIIEPPSPIFMLYVMGIVKNVKLYLMTVTVSQFMAVIIVRHGVTSSPVCSS
jgi:hypothetical protein